jgi:hypothetical protein
MPAVQQNFKTSSILKPKRSTLVLVAAFSVPFWGLFLGKEGVFLAYSIVVALGFKFWVRPPALFYIFASACLIAAIAHIQSLKSVIDITALIIVTLYAYTVASILVNLSFVRAIKALYKYCIYTIFLAFVVSIVLSGPLGLMNPINTILTGDRLMLLASAGGHSILNDLAALGLICLSLGIKLVPQQLWIRLLLSLFLILAGSSTTFLVVLVIWAVALFEGAHRAPNIQLTLMKTLCHFSMLLLILLIALNPLTTNEIMKNVRLLAGQGNNQYYGDYTAGRALLTVVLVDAANEAPYFGSGDDHPVLTYGVTLITGKEKGATSESPLRLAVKFGWPFFTLNLAIWLSTLFIGLTSKGIHRSFFILSGYTLLVLTTTNAGFSTPQSTTSIVFSPLLWFGILSARQQNMGRLFSMQRLQNVKLDKQRTSK